MKPAEGPFAESPKPSMARGRYGRGADIAAMVAYLAGLEAGSVTGASLTVDGGFLA
jgi:3-oxoacyl-[acyl-carrier protein] reductase